MNAAPEHYLKSLKALSEAYREGRMSTTKYMYHCKRLSASFMIATIGDVTGRDLPIDIELPTPNRSKHEDQS